MRRKGLLLTAIIAVNAFSFLLFAEHKYVPLDEPIVGCYRHLARCHGDIRLTCDYVEGDQLCSIYYENCLFCE